MNLREQFEAKSFQHVAAEAFQRQARHRDNAANAKPGSIDQMTWSNAACLAQVHAARSARRARAAMGLEPASGWTYTNGY